MGLIFDIGFKTATNFEDIPWNLDGLRWVAGSGEILSNMTDIEQGTMNIDLNEIREKSGLKIHETEDIPINVPEWAGKVDYMLTFDLNSLKAYVEKIIASKIERIKNIPINPENYYEIKKVMFPEIIVNFYGNIYVDDEILDIIDELRTIPADERPIWSLWEFDEANTTWIIA